MSLRYFVRKKTPLYNVDFLIIGNPHPSMESEELCIAIDFGTYPQLRRRNDANMDK